MFKTLALILALGATVAAGAVPSLAAKTHPATKRRTPANYGFVYVTKGLIPGHRYRITISSTGHTRFGGRGFENYTWLNKRQSGESTKPLTFSGSTPKTYVLTQPVSAKLISWIVALSVSDTNLRPLRVMFKDLGAHK